MYINNDAVKSSRRIIYAEVGIGIALIAFMIWLGIFVLEDSGDMTVINIFLFPLIVPFYVAAVKRWVMHAELKSYSQIMKKNSVMSFVEIGKKLGKPADDVLKDFEWMDANNILDNTYVDSRNYQVYFGCSPFAKNKDKKAIQGVSKSMVAHICPFCCGMTMIEKGKDGICDWCRGPIGDEDDDK